ncbi:hypothetical protein CCACVL1_12493 [Corchorus capsularis]|uniref:Uncharacterized protein n=1 Tax=Corchorus capsularis TaxID=210143 RepID=A0A1R3IFE2_COCAP|nr:hypothetical protein CCACVL1_12493 [Corchorus capsularis]
MSCQLTDKQNKIRARIRCSDHHNDKNINHKIKASPELKQTGGSKRKDPSISQN